MTTTGFPAPTLAIGGVALPAGVTFADNGNGTATLSGTPAAGTGGTYDVTFTATNGIGANAAQAFTLTVNEPPIITSANTATFLLNTAGDDVSGGDDRASGPDGERHCRHAADRAHTDGVRALLARRRRADPSRSRSPPPTARCRTRRRPSPSWSTRR